jgi:hypothetical protein
VERQYREPLNNFQTWRVRSIAANATDVSRRVETKGITLRDDRGRLRDRDITAM